MCRSAIFCHRPLKSSLGKRKDGHVDWDFMSKNPSCHRSRVPQNESHHRTRWKQLDWNPNRIPSKTITRVLSLSSWDSLLVFLGWPMKWLGFFSFLWRSSDYGMIWHKNQIMNYLSSRFSANIFIWDDEWVENECDRVAERINDPHVTVSQSEVGFHRRVEIESRNAGNNTMIVKFHSLDSRNYQNGRGGEQKQLRTLFN